MIPTRPRNPRKTPLRAVADWLADELVEIRGSDPERSVSGITNSTQRVVPGDLYVAPAGAKAHGASFAADAVRDGAVAVLTDVFPAYREYQRRVGALWPKLKPRMLQ